MALFLPKSKTVAGRAVTPLSAFGSFQRAWTPDKAASGANVSSPRALAYLKLRSALDDRLTDPALSPTALAKAAGLSVRHANFILADHDTSLERFIQRARLERCRRAFSDPSQAHRTITEIALGWGFSDPTLFSRIFKRTYGLTPRDYRGQRRASDASQRA